MRKLLLLPFFLLLFPVILRAQDTLWVKQKDGHPYLLHKVKSGETLFLLSKKYAVPPAILADANKVSYQDGLAPGSKFRIPIDNYNFIRIESVIKSRPIYYRAGEEDDLRAISRMFNVPQSAIQRWNDMKMQDVEAGDVLQVGWIAFDKSQVPFAQSTLPEDVQVKATPLPETRNPAKKLPESSRPIKTADQDSVPEVSAFETLYRQQTTGVALTEEQGAAVFYPLKTKTAAGVYYALHNTALRGSILEIRNPANGKVIYAKVIGTMPKLKEYHNAVLGLSNNAISALGAIDQRMFCKVKYR